jgi:hypothetical protein
MEEYAEMDGLLAIIEPIIPLSDALEPNAFGGFITPNIPLLQWVGTAQWKYTGFVSLTICVKTKPLL